MDDSDDEEFSSADFAEQLTGEFRSKLQQLTPKKNENTYKVFTLTFLRILKIQWRVFFFLEDNYAYITFTASKNQLFINSILIIYYFLYIFFDIFSKV